MITRQGNAKKLVDGFRRIEEDLSRRHQALVRAILTDLVTHSPQWSGTLASQWYVEAGGRKGRYRASLKMGKQYRNQLAYSAGDDPAVASTLLRESLNIDRIRYYDTVRIVNKTPYAEEVEQGLESGGMMPNGMRLRMENLMPYYGGIGLIGYVDMKYRLNGGAKGVLNAIRKPG